MSVKLKVYLKYDKIGNFLCGLCDPCGKSYPNEIGKSSHLMGQEN